MLPWLCDEARLKGTSGDMRYIDVGKESGFAKVLQRWTMAITVGYVLSACSLAIPRQYIDQAEPGVTLTALTSNPEAYREKVVILGGVIVEEQDSGEHVFLRLKNRPLDKEYHPHRPLSLDGPEAGYYWVMMGRGELPEQHHQWARVTVVGQVTGKRPSAATEGALEPVLAALYVRGWGDSIMSSSASTARGDRNQSISVPKGARGEFSQ